MSKRFLSVILLSLVVLVGCASDTYTITREPSFQPAIWDEMAKLWSPVRGSGFCVNATSIYNILPGGLFMEPVPLCNEGDIVAHSHPLIAEPWASPVDLWAWGQYYKRYGGKRFGILLGPKSFTLYERR